MKGFYQITEALNAELKAVGFNTVTFGDITEVDLKRQSIYPLAHITPSTVSSAGHINQFTFELIGMDLVDFNKGDVDTVEIPFFGIDNKQDILHDILHKMQLALEQFRRGDAFTDLMQLDEGRGYEPFLERFENVLAGWDVSLTITAPKDASIC